MEKARLVFNHIRQWVFGLTTADRSLLESSKEFICDALWMIGLDWDLLTTGQQDNYAAAVKTMLGLRLLTELECLTQLDERPLSACELIDSQSQFTKRVRRVRTKLVYMQQKYNLLREENEGFSRLLMILSSARDDKKLLVQKVAGAFDLDPNRVADIVLDVMELYPMDDQLLEIVKVIKPSNLAQLMGFKVKDTPTINEGTAVVLGRLVKDGEVCLEQLWPHLVPENTVVTYNARFKLAQDLKLACNIVSLSGNATARRTYPRVRC